MDRDHRGRPPARLVLADGRVFSGVAIGAPVRSSGEVVFSTSMTGYQEALTDPSFRGQLLTMTYPLQGNYGTSSQASESDRVQVRGFIVRELTDLPSHWQNTATLDEYLARAGIPGISEVDTRALTRHLRSHGVVMGTITHDESGDAALARLRDEPGYEGRDFVAEVSTAEAFDFVPDGGGPLLAAAESTHPPERARSRLVVVDLGVKRNILRILERRGCQMTVVPHHTSAEEILSMQPDGVLLSPGPGDPRLLDHVVTTTRGLIGRTPLMGICLGHQVVGRAFGAGVYKLKFGHRGANHPVLDRLSGRVYITSQNHGYAVDDRLGPDLRISHVHLNDETVEGLEHVREPVFTIQYHSEASPGPNDTEFLFDRFMAAVRGDG